MAGTSIDRAALAALLDASGLFDTALAADAAKLGGQFPAAVERNIFLECELAERASPAGFGLGFSPGDLDLYLARGGSFGSSPAGQAVEAALAADPFAADHAAYLNLLGDSDPDWVEYDIADRCIDPTPFIFFRLPSRFRVLTAPRQARDLCRILPGASDSGEFADLLDVLVALGRVNAYRIGVAQRRGQGWWRAIISNLHEDQVSAALTARGATDFERPLRRVRDFYATRIDNPGACFALSIDIQDDRIVAMDVETPYLFRIGNHAIRTTAFRDLLTTLAEDGIMPGSTATWLAGYCCRDVSVPGTARHLRVMVHHLKVRFLGSPHLRTKGYFHLDMADGAAFGGSIP